MLMRIICFSFAKIEVCVGKGLITQNGDFLFEDDSELGKEAILAYDGTSLFNAGRDLPDFISKTLGRPRYADLS